jgi:hypothetical protein
VDLSEICLERPASHAGRFLDHGFRNPCSGLRGSHPSFLFSVMESAVESLVSGGVLILVRSWMADGFCAYGLDMFEQGLRWQLSLEEAAVVPGPNRGIQRWIKLHPYGTARGLVATPVIAESLNS